MTRAHFSGPLVSNAGIELGPPDNRITLIDEDGKWSTGLTFGTSSAPMLLYGDVVGDITGDIVGDVTGDLTGDVTGNVTGNITGNVIGHITGNSSGLHYGAVYGNVAGNVTGDLTGNSSGTHTGITYGQVGSIANPTSVYGYLTGAFIGNAAFAVSTETSTELAAETTGLFRLQLTSSLGIALTTSDGVFAILDMTTST